MKKILIILILLLTIGCSSYTELNNLGVIHIIGIEKVNNKYKLYASIIKEKQGDEIKTIISIVEGNTINEAINNLSLNLNKEIYMSHLDTLLINDSLNNFDLKEIINYFINNDKTREDFLVATTSDIEKIITNSNFRETNNLIETSLKENSLSIYTTLSDFIKNYYNNNPIYLTNFEIDNNIKIKDIKKIFNNKYQTINIEDSLFINYLNNNINLYNYNLICNQNNSIYLNIISSRTNQFNNQYIITNEINILNNNCNLSKNNINKLFTNYLKNNLEKYTNKKIIIQNNIRSHHENN